MTETLKSCDMIMTEAVGAKEIRCCHCGRKLGDISQANGFVRLVFKCPRCKGIVIHEIK